jgi:hypothetical protein
MRVPPGYGLLLGLLLLLASCSGRDPAACRQIAQSDSSLNVVVASQALREHPGTDYAAAIAALLRSVPPFGTRGMNVYGVAIPDAECGVTTETYQPQLSCDWGGVNALLAACDLAQAKVLIITGNDVQSVSVPVYYGSSIAIINEKAYDRYSVLHEFGHLFGLQEESKKLRVPPYSPAFASRKPNCAPNISMAKEWWRLYEDVNGTGYYEGCAGHADYIRPNNETLMGDAFEWADYGYVSTLYLAQAYDCCYAANRTAYSCAVFFKEYPGWAACR